MDNLYIYEQGRNVPKEAQKGFDNGSFKGTDINPMWRIKKITEIFGPAGLGWYTEVVEHWEETINGETLTNVAINLYVKYNGEWSKPIYGIGGNKALQVFPGKNGAPDRVKVSDEAYKMAYTDAISVACKALGIGADIYFEKDVTKYTQYQNNGDFDPFSTAPKTQQKPKTQPKQQTAPQTPAYQPLSKEDYDKTIASYALGNKTNRGQDIRTWWYNATHAGSAELQKFDADVAAFKKFNKIQ